MQQAGSSAVGPLIASSCIERVDVMQSGVSVICSKYPRRRRSRASPVFITYY